MKWLLDVRAPALVLGVALLCLSIHELGHAIAGVVTGRPVKQFVILSSRPHVSFTAGGTPTEEAFSVAAGTGLTVLVWFSLLMFAPGRRQLFSITAFSGMALIELLGWILSSLWPPGSSSPDDAEAFLRLTGIAPGLLIAVCLLIAVTGVFLACVRPGAQRNRVITVFDPIE